MTILPDDKLNRYTFLMWFILATVALAASGIYAILPILLRTPIFAELFHFKDFFRTSLVVHVDLSVLVWFLSATAMLMTSVTKQRFAPVAFSAFIASMMGTVAMMASPFVGHSEAVLNNYVPILHNFAFVIGIALFLSGIMLQMFLTLLSNGQIKDDLIRFTIYVSAMIFLVAVICFIKAAIGLKHLALERFVDLTEYYELLFWGAGHILQFNYVQLIVIVWLTAVGKQIYDPSRRYFYALESMNFILVSLSIAAYFIYPIDSPELYDFFTKHMKYTGGILLIFVVLWVAYNLRSIKSVAFNCSVLLILSGGIIGYLISGINVTIPAHYHGVIIGITVGLMGFFYMLLPQMGFTAVGQKKAAWQMIIYTIGQMIHISGLAISGGYGALRKSPEGFLSIKAKIYMGIMGLGGAIALIGGIMFVILVFISICSESSNMRGENE